MILTGKQIKKEVQGDNITIAPFFENQINPNSYNYRLGEQITYWDDQGNLTEVTISQDGFMIEPHRTYLGHTYETLGSDKYAMSLIGRSSTGRLGLFLQVSADLGHTGAVHKWTLEIVAARRIVLYPQMIIGQISFWMNDGSIDHYRDGYSQYSNPQISKFESDDDTHR